MTDTAAGRLNVFNPQHNILLIVPKLLTKEVNAAYVSGIVNTLTESGRPLLCTEYMARPAGCRFDTHLPYFKEHNIGALNWGLVAGKTQTQFPWEAQPGQDEPPLWFHDIFRKDGTPYLTEEVDLIRKLTGAKNSQ